MVLDVISLRDHVACIDDLKEQQVNGYIGIAEIESIKSGSSKAGLRRLRTESRTQHNIRRLQAANPNAICANGNEELAQVLIKYGNNPDGIPALLYAIKLNDEKAVKLMLESGASPNTRVRQERGAEYNYNNLPSNAIEYAAAYSSPNIAALLESYGAEIGNKFEFRKDGNQNILIQSPMSVAVAFDNLDMLRYLVSKGVSIHESNQMNYDYGQPIVIAAQCNSLNSFKYLVSSGVNISGMKDVLLNSSVTAKGSDVLRLLLENHGPFSSITLDFALGAVGYHGDLDLMRLLIKKGANPESAMSLIYQESRYYPAKYAAIELLLSSGADPKKLIHGRMPMDIAVGSGDVPLVKLLLKYGAELNPQFTPNPLQNQQVYRFPEMVKFLIASGVPVNKSYDGGMTPLHYASQCQDAAAAVSIELLVSAGANVKAITKDGQTPLHLACHQGTDAAVLKLLLAGSDINSIDRMQCKPYHRIQNSSIEVMNLFLQKGADFNEFSSWGACPVVHLFMWRVDAEAVYTFLISQNKIDINVKDKYGQSMVHKSAQYGRFDFLKFLINNNANINARDNQGKTPLNIAKDHQQHLVTWLIEHGAN